MGKLQTASHTITVKVADKQYEFLENRIKELGLLSMAELIRFYIASDMTRIGEEPVKKRRFSLEGIFRDGKVTDEDLEEVKHIWNSRELP